MASRVEKRMARALPVLRIDRLAGVMPILAASSPEDILRRASITSMLTIIAMMFVLCSVFRPKLSDSQPVFLRDPDSEAVDEGEGEKYQREE